MRPEVLLAIAIVFISTFFALQVFLFALFYREQVKKTCVQKPTGQSTSAGGFLPFGRAIVSARPDLMLSIPIGDGAIYQASCLVYKPLLENPLSGSFRVKWLTDVVISRETSDAGLA